MQTFNFFKEDLPIIVAMCIKTMLNKNTLGVKKVQGQSEATMVI